MNRVASVLDRGVVSPASLRQRLGISPATLMRLIRDAGPAVVRLGRGRAIRYGLRQTWAGLDDWRFPLVRISEAGVPEPAGELVTLAARQSVWLPEGRVSDGLPVDLTDARPSGFLGRHFAAIHDDLRLPPRLEDWSDHHILLALARRGDDLPGNLIVGEESFARWQAGPPASASRDDYPALADQAIAGHPPGSSAGGERPKFGVVVDGRQVLVKFAGRGAGADAVARRWCDLLVLEALALDIVRTRDIAVPATQLIETPTHCFLESERFDRVGLRGRRGVLSLAALHDNAADSWRAAALALVARGTLADEDGRRLRWLDAFGALIGNTDRHQHNLAFFTGHGQPRLAPIFDQLPMLYAPSADGQVPARTFTVPLMAADSLDVWSDARDAARAFWSRAANDTRVAAELRAAASANARLLA
jgi:hypothetical protein